MAQVDSARISDLIERIVAITRSPQSTPFYRRAIAALGGGLVEEELGELRYHMNVSEVVDPARYFTALLQKRLSVVECAADRMTSCGAVSEGDRRAPSRRQGEVDSVVAGPSRIRRNFHSSTGLELFTELKPLAKPGGAGSDEARMNFGYSTKSIPWATFIGPEFFTLSTNPAKSDRVMAKFRVLGGKVTEVPLIRGRLFPQDDERGILTAEEGRILGAMECLWVEQGCQFVRCGNGSVFCSCRVPIRRLAQLLGWKTFGGRDLAHLKRKAISLKVTGYYLELDAVEELRRAGLKGYGFSLVDGFDLIDKVRHRLEQTTFRVTFSDPYSRQLLARRVVTRPKGMLKMRSELAFLLRLYLEPILISRGIGQEHSIGLVNLIKVLNLPAAGWHRFKSRRKAIFVKAIQELQGMKTADSRRIEIEIQQVSDQRDFMLIARLLSSEFSQRSAFPP